MKTIIRITFNVSNLYVFVKSFLEVVLVLLDLFAISERRTNCTTASLLEWEIASSGVIWILTFSRVRFLLILK